MLPTHPNEPLGNDWRRRLLAVEPRGLRTFTPSLAVIQRAEGSYVFTVDGRKLADFTSGVLVANLGHNPARWWRRVWDYLGLSPGSDSAPFLSAVPLTAYNAATDVEILATERLLTNLQSAPGGARCQQVLWAASGSEAIQKALWAALARDRERDLIVATRHGFHGKKGLAGAVTGSEESPERDPRVKFLSFPRDECRSLARRRQPIELAPYEQELAALKAEHGHRLCCLITEPYLGGGGSFHPQPEYLQLLQQFCRDNDLLFILDEVQSNFGRTGETYAFTTYGVEPDLVVLGKGLGNGVPVAAVAGRADVFAGLAYGEASDTWSANPLSSAAVLATLEEFENGQVLEQAREVGEALERGLTRLEELPLVANVRGEGSVWGVEIGPLSEATAEEVASAVVEACYLGDENGLALHLLGPLAGNVIRISPPLVMPAEEVELYLDAAYRILKTLARKLVT